MDLLLIGICLIVGVILAVLLLVLLAGLIFLLCLMFSKLIDFIDKKIKKKEVQSDE